MENFEQQIDDMQKRHLAEIEQLRQDFLASCKPGNKLPEISYGERYYYPCVSRDQFLKFDHVHRSNDLPTATNLCITEAEHAQFGQIQLKLYEAIGEQTRLLFHCGIAEKDASFWTIRFDAYGHLTATEFNRGDGYPKKYPFPPFATKEAAELALSMASNNLKALWDGSIWYRNEVIK